MTSIGDKSIQVFLGIGVMVLLALMMSLQRPSIRFDWEEITLTIFSNRTEVRATYIFSNPTQKKQQIPVFYPIPRKEGMGPAELFKAWLVQDEERITLPMELNGNNYVFMLSIPPGDKCELNITYQQATASPYAKYILMTTWLWFRPLEKTILNVIADKDLESLTINYEMEKTAEINDKVQYRTVKKSFIPLKFFKS